MQWPNPRYAICLPLHLNTVTVVIESLKFTNREQTGAKKGGQHIKVSIEFCCVF